MPRQNLSQKSYHRYHWPACFMQWQTLTWSPQNNRMHCRDGEEVWSKTADNPNSTQLLEKLQYWEHMDRYQLPYPHVECLFSGRHLCQQHARRDGTPNYGGWLERWAPIYPKQSPSSSQSRQSQKSGWHVWCSQLLEDCPRGEEGTTETMRKDLLLVKKYMKPV